MSYQRTRKKSTINLLLSILRLTQSFPARTLLGLCQPNSVSHNQKIHRLLRLPSARSTRKPIYKRDKKLGSGILGEGRGRAPPRRTEAVEAMEWFSRNLVQGPPRRCLASLPPPLTTGESDGRTCASPTASFFHRRPERKL